MPNSLAPPRYTLYSTQYISVIRYTCVFDYRSLLGRGRLEHIGLGFLKFSLILYNSDGKIREKVV